MAVDGPDAAGKTTLADALAAELTVPVVRASVDGFHRPRALRVDYYRDSFDLDCLVEVLLRPFRDGARRVQSCAFDHRTDAALPLYVDRIADRAVLVLDGVFLHRPELRPWWTWSVYLDVPEAVCLERARSRDVPFDEQRYRSRYLPAQAAYRRQVGPADLADLVLDAQWRLARPVRF